LGDFGRNNRKRTVFHSGATSLEQQLRPIFSADEWPKGIGIGGIRGFLPAALFIGVGGGAVAVAAPPGNICEGWSLG